MYPRLQRLLAIGTLALAAQATMSGTAAAQVSVNIQIGPPAPLFEQVPVLRPGLVWAPGYWAWHEDRHIWVRGRTMVQRAGYRWEPDVWEQRDNRYYRHPGRWERNTGDRAQPQALQMRPAPRGDDAGGRGRGNGHNQGRPDKNRKHDKR